MDEKKVQKRVKRKLRGAPFGTVPTIRYNGRLRIIDQRALPGRLSIVESRNINDVYQHIKRLAVRGAPAIGVFAAYGVCIGLKAVKTDDKRAFFKELSKITAYIKASRPTAVNLFWALNRIEERALIDKDKSVSGIKKSLIREAKKIHGEDEQMCRAIGINGARLIKRGETILTHCNAGLLATAGEGTALAPIYRAHAQGKRIKVFADETRPLLQGARLTAWELRRKGIDVTLICDNMAAALMKKHKIDKVIVGADRIAANGDTANKIGTYGLAVLAKAHKIPFYVAAPSSTLDLSIIDGDKIPIEERSGEEVRKISGIYTAPKCIKAYNPAFDVTPNRYISAVITEKGIFERPYKRSLKKAFV